VGGCGKPGDVDAADALSSMTDAAADLSSMDAALDAAFDSGRDSDTDRPRDSAEARVDSAVDLASSCGPDGTECRPTSDRCKVSGKCRAGVCGAITNAADETPCGTASNACYTQPVCKAGQCQAQQARPDGYNYDTGNYLARCCGGSPSSINTANNCGACGIKCGDGKCVNTGSKNSQQWWCTCTASSSCWSGCCVGTSPGLCSPSTCYDAAKCITCPGGASCQASQEPHYWCHY
jgi:hypothetical protein